MRFCLAAPSRAAANAGDTACPVCGGKVETLGLPVSGSVVDGVTSRVLVHRALQMSRCTQCGVVLAMPGPNALRTDETR